MEVKLAMKTSLVSSALIAAFLTAAGCVPKHPPSATSAPLPSKADTQMVDQLVTQIFETFDTNQDQKISSDEYAHGVIITFHHLDRDRNLKLHITELSGHWDVEAQAVDLDGDGYLTLSEILSHQSEAFKQRDLDNNGYLEWEEVMLWIINKLEQQQRQPETAGGK